MSCEPLSFLFARPETVSLVEAVAPGLQVRDPDGEVIHGPADAPGDAHPILAGGKRLGEVRAKSNAEAAAALLTHLAKNTDFQSGTQQEDEFREITLALSSELKLAPLLDKIMQATARLLDAERSTLFLNEEKTGELWSPVALGMDETMRFPNDRGIAGSVFTTGQSINIPDAYADSRFNPDLDKSTGFTTRNILCCPVINKEGTRLGVIQALNKTEGPFSARDEDRLTAFAAQASIAIENAKLYNHMEELVRERTRELNETLQVLQDELDKAAEYVKKLLPEPLEHEVVTTDWRYVPSSSLGGDAFGYHWLDENHFAVYLNDVSGHGVGAALLSVSVMNMLRSHNLPVEDFRDPAQVMAALNASYPMEQHNYMFFTMWYGVYNKVDRTLTFASAGHPPALHFSGADAATDKLWTHNMLLGGMPDQTYHVDTRRMEPGDSILVFSDGVYEVEKKDGTIWSFDEFMEFMDGDNQPGMDGLMAFTKRLSGTDGWEDDFSILEIRFP